MEKVKMFLFARWIATCYADEHCDSQLITQHEPDFNRRDSKCVLNWESGGWWKKQLEYFISEVYPNLEKNGSVQDAYKFLYSIKDYCSCDKPWNINGTCILCEKPIKTNNKLIKINHKLIKINHK